MGLEQMRAYSVMCDYAGCEAACPGDMDDLHWYLAHAVKLTEVEARYEAQNLAIDDGWMDTNDRWFCPNHCPIDDDDETVEVGADAHQGRVRVDPVVVTCAVRYALGRSSYMPGLMADVVRACWEDLGDQREVIREDVRRWLVDEMPASWMVDRETWEILDRWMGERS